MHRSATGFHRSLPGYRPTPLRPAPGLAEALGIGHCLVKDESDRLGLPAFKVLGASWAANATLSERTGEGPADTLATLRARLGGQRPTLVTATDGNHGRALAWMARLLNIPARIYVPAGVAPAAEQAIRAEGAETVLTDRTYDEAVTLAAASCAGATDQVLGAGHVLARLHRDSAAHSGRLPHLVRGDRRPAPRALCRPWWWCRPGSDRCCRLHWSTTAHPSALIAPLCWPWNPSLPPA